jgi:xylan 1,4-beta-xylosidase
MTAPIPIDAAKTVGLRVEVDEERLCFAFRLGDGPWQPLPHIFDASILSDEAQRPGTPNFTGAFVGMTCQDLAGTARHADFGYFSYRERDFRVDPFPDLADGF